MIANSYATAADDGVDPTMMMMMIMPPEIIAAVRMRIRTSATGSRRGVHASSSDVHSPTKRQQKRMLLRAISCFQLNPQKRISAAEKYQHTPTYSRLVVLISAPPPLLLL